jgi:hypothetical protein
MIDRADSNGDSAVTPDDFYNIMTKKTFVWEADTKIRSDLRPSFYFAHLSLLHLR